MRQEIEIEKVVEGRRDGLDLAVPVHRPSSIELYVFPTKEDHGTVALVG